MRGLTLTLAIGAAAASGCAGSLQYPGTTNYKVVQGYDARRPSDVAVLPIAGTLDAEAAAALREGLRARLLELHYAPVKVREVDGSIGDFKPGGANAVIEVSITKWDDSGLFGDGSVRASGQIRLFGAGSTEVLYRGELKDVPVRASFVAHSLEDRPTTLWQAAAEVAWLLLDQLPVKGDG